MMQFTRKNAASRKLIRKFILLILSAGYWFSGNGQVQVSGSVGADGIYPNLTQENGAFAAINQFQQDGRSVLIAIDTNLFDENGTVALEDRYWDQLLITATHPVVISGSHPDGILRFNQTQQVTLQGGNDSLAPLLTLKNLQAGPVLQLVNRVRQFRIHQCVLEGSGNSSGEALLSINTTFGMIAGDHIDISNCRFQPAPGLHAAYGLWITSAGLTNYQDLMIFENDFAGISSSFGASSAMLMDAGTSLVQITGNRIYFPDSLQADSLIYTAIAIQSPTGSGFTVRENRIGGTGATDTFDAFIKGRYIQLTGVQIQTQPGSSGWDAVNSNQIENLTIQADSSTKNGAGVFTGFYLQTGKHRVGTEGGNRIGKTNSSGHIRLQVLNNSYSAQGILSENSDSSLIRFNEMDNWVVNGCDSAGFVWNGISVKGNPPFISCTQNKIGGISGIHLSETTNGSCRQSGHGIFWNTSTNGHEITGNQITNLSNQSNSAEIENYLYGIYVSGSNPRIDSNIIRQLNYHGTNNSNIPLVGILLGASGDFLSVNNNVIDHLIADNSLATNMVVTAFKHALGNATIAGNRCFDLVNRSQGGYIAGIWKNNSGATRAMNNRFHLTNGWFSNRMQIAGIINNNADGDLICWYNTIFISGTNGSGSGNGFNSICFQRFYGGTVDVRNNIFINQRTGFGNHFVMANTSANATGWLSDHNILSAVNPSAFAVWGTSGSGGIRDFDGWKLSSLSDSNSVVTLPIFSDTLEAALTMRMKDHCGLAGLGTSVGVSVDCLGSPRKLPTDIGPFEFSGKHTQWIGTNSNWWDPANWCGRIPDAQLDVYIPGDRPFYPDLQPGEAAQVQNLFLNQLSPEE